MHIKSNIYVFAKIKLIISPVAVHNSSHIDDEKLIEFENDSVKRDTENKQFAFKCELTNWQMILFLKRLVVKQHLRNVVVRVNGQTWS